MGWSAANLGCLKKIQDQILPLTPEKGNRLRVDKRTEIDQPL